MAQEGNRDVCRIHAIAETDDSLLFIAMARSFSLTVMPWQ